MGLFRKDAKKNLKKEDYDQPEGKAPSLRGSQDEVY